MYSRILSIEKKGLFYINFLLIVFVIISFTLKIPLKYFFYFDIILTLIISYLYFLKSKKLSKILIITDIYIFFIFLLPFIEGFLFQLFYFSSYYIRVFYNLFVTYLFINFSNTEKRVFRVDKLSWKKTFYIFIFSIFMGFLFFLVKEPAPPILYEFVKHNTLDNLSSLVLNSFLVALSEELMMIGIFYLSYKQLTNSLNAKFQAALIFVMFHIIRFSNIVKFYFINFRSYYLVYSIVYYFLLFIFMVFALHFFENKNLSFNLESILQFQEFKVKS